MLEIIEVDGRQLKFEANLGTAELYQILTGENIFNIIAVTLSDVKKEIDPTTKLAIMARLNDTYKKLAYIMNVTAETEDPEPLKRINNIKIKLNMDLYLVWLMQFKNGSMDMDFFKKIAALWSAQQETHSEQKN